MNKQGNISSIQSLNRPNYLQHDMRANQRVIQPSRPRVNVADVLLKLHAEEDEFINTKMQKRSNIYTDLKKNVTIMDQDISKQWDQEIKDQQKEINILPDRPTLAKAVNSLKRKRIVNAKTVKFAGAHQKVDENKIQELDDDNIGAELRKMESQQAVHQIRKEKAHAIQNLQQLKSLSKNPQVDKEVTILEKSNYDWEVQRNKDVEMKSALDLNRKDGQLNKQNFLNMTVNNEIHQQKEGKKEYENSKVRAKNKNE